MVIVVVVSGVSLSLMLLLSNVVVVIVGHPPVSLSLLLESRPNVFAIVVGVVAVVDTVPLCLWCLLLLLGVFSCCNSTPNWCVALSPLVLLGFRRSFLPLPSGLPSLPSGLLFFLYTSRSHVAGACSSPSLLLHWRRVQLRCARRC